MCDRRFHALKRYVQLKYRRRRRTCMSKIDHTRVMKIDRFSGQMKSHRSPAVR